jgi:hypothetical protein
MSEASCATCGHRHLDRHRNDGCAWCECGHPANCHCAGCHPFGTHDAIREALKRAQAETERTLREIYDTANGPKGELFARLCEVLSLVRRALAPKSVGFSSPLVGGDPPTPEERRVISGHAWSNHEPCKCGAPPPGGYSDKTYPGPDACPLDMATRTPEEKEET